LTLFAPPPSSASKPRPNPLFTFAIIFSVCIDC
jgi:hypothetical protein